MSLVEALVAFAVMAIGMLAVTGLQSTLRFNSDIAKQRSEATRLAQEQMEKLRAFSVLGAASGAAAYDDIASQPRAAVQGYTLTNTTYMIATEVQKSADPVQAAVTVKVSWEDRQGTRDGNGEPPTVVLHSIIAGIDPALSGLLSMRPDGMPVRQPLGRNLGIPFGARDLGDDRSVFKPEGPPGTVAWVFNNATALVTSRCTVPAGSTASSLTASDLVACVPVTGRAVTGSVRFDTDGTVSAAEAENPSGSPALDLDMALALQGGASSECFDDAPAQRSASVVEVHYACLVLATLSGGGPAPWSGRLAVTPVGWRFGSSAADFRLCRYSADYDGRDGIGNAEHPRDYSEVAANLANQNFLVVRGDNACPSDVAADPARGDFVDSSTVELAPRALL